MQYRSQYGQDRFIDAQVFRGMRDGTFVEIGADDGVSGSNTLFFEAERGWNGVCIEPRREAFEKLRSNRSCACENACISDSSGDREFLEVAGDARQLSGLVESYDPRHLERIRREASSARTISTRCMTLAEALSKHGIGDVDYLSVDTEGSELEILESIDFSRTKIRCISVENNYHDPRIKKLLASKGYRLLTRIKIDEIYALVGSGADRYREPLEVKLHASISGIKRLLRPLIRRTR